MKNLLFDVGAADTTYRRFPKCEFLTAAGEEWSCEGCGRRKWRPTGRGRCTLESGGKWADFMSGTGCTLPFMVSERVVEACVDSGLSGFEACAVDISVIDSDGDHLATSDAPSYFYLRIHGMVDFDLAASNVSLVDACPVCYSASQRTMPDRYALDVSTWDGSDFLHVRNYPSSLTFCSMRVVSLARKHHWTNLRFIPCGVPLMQTYTWKGVDYLGKQWPPMMIPP